MARETREYRVRINPTVQQHLLRLSLPVNAWVMSVEYAYDCLIFHTFVEVGKPSEHRDFVVIGTNTELIGFDLDDLLLVGTVRESGVASHTAWHVFEVDPK